MRIQLPVETWIEILDWLKRRDLLTKLDQLWDREFTPIIQDWLHKYTRNVTIGELQTRSDGLSVCKNSWKCEPVLFADVDMPGNVTSFNHIAIGYLDTTVLTFLSRMRPLFHNNKIHLAIADCYPAGDELPTQTALRHLMPIIGGGSTTIESLFLTSDFLQFFSTNYPSALSNAKSLRMCDYFKMDVTSKELLTSWLFTPHADGQPRTLVFLSEDPPFYDGPHPESEDPAGFWEKLRERFLDPTRQSACPFFIRTRITDNLPPLGSAIENFCTGEQLSVNGFWPPEEFTMHGITCVLISNCALNNVVVDPEWLAKKREEMREWDLVTRRPRIWLSGLNWLELGPLDGEA